MSITERTIIELTIPCEECGHDRLGIRAKSEDQKMVAVICTYCDALDPADTPSEDDGA